MKIKEELKAEIIDIMNDVFKDGEAKSIESTLLLMEKSLQDQGVYSYSDFDMDLNAILPDIFRLFLDKIADFNDFERLCSTMPLILKWLPYESDERIYGYVHTFDLEPLKELLTKFVGLEDTLNHFNKGEYRQYL